MKMRKTRGCYCNHWAPDDGGERPKHAEL